MIMQARQLCDQAAQLLRGNVDNVILYYCCIAVEIAFVYPSIAVTNHFTFFFHKITAAGKASANYLRAAQILEEYLVDVTSVQVGHIACWSLTTYFSTL